MSEIWQSEQMQNNNGQKNNEVSARNGKDFWVGVMAGFFVMLVISLVMVILLVRSFDKKNPVAASDKKDVYEAITQLMSGNKVLDDETSSTLSEIATIFENYSIYEMSAEDMRRGMIDGLVEGTGDRYAEYFTAEEFEKLMTGYDGVIYGIGALMYLDDNEELTIQKVFEDSPAGKEGLRAGDIVIEVDGKDVYGQSLTESVNMIRGEKDTPVQLKIYREGESDYLDFTVIRGEVKTVTVNYEMLEDSIGYIGIEEFDEVTIEQFSEALNDLKSQNMKALIIDLRTNGGGLLNVVVDILRMMLPEGMIVYTEDNFEKKDEYFCDGKNELKIPMVVLTNEYTASASEIMTGALQDYHMATVMGTNTYGKGVVQSFIPLKNGSYLKLTLSQYYTAGGRMIDGEGIAPDIVVEFDGETYYGSNRTIDNQKNAAIEYLQNELSK